jgi:DegV family protein with EDD domain
LARALAAGARAVAREREALDRINVFPVADNDTGSNLTATLDRVARGVARLRSQSAADVARTAADEALMGARGNSGAIFAQFFEGFASGLGDARRAGAGLFARSVNSAAEMARGAMAFPQEGTILSVIRVWARSIEERSHAAADFADLLPGSLPAAEEALERTPDSLPQLRKAGVVDAGARGFVVFLKGVAGSLGRGQAEAPAAAAGDVVEVHLREARESILFRFCTEVLVEGTGIDRDALRRAAAPLGDSLAVVGGATRIRLHIHVNRPEDVFEIVRRFGRVEETKVEDMRSQHVGRFAEKDRVSIVTDSACDLPDAALERHGVTVVPLRLMIGEETFLDRITITPAEFQRRLREGGVVPRTSQPPPADFREVYRALASHGSPVLGVHLSSGLSGTFNAARTAAASLRGEEGLAAIEAIDSKSVSVAQGLVVLEAAKAAADGKTLAEVEAIVRRASARARILATTPSLDFLVRGGRVRGVQGIVARALGILPIITVDAEGKAVRGGAARGFSRACRGLVAKALAGTRDVPAPTFGIAHFEAPELADQIAKELLSRHPGADHFVVEVAPALAAHVGPGAVAVGFLGAETPSGIIRA